jgi:polysaccharide chain length determinant protein (PEP-CTERM system associated)
MGAPQNYVSVSRRPLDVEDYIDLMRRHRSWIIGPMFAGLVISVVVAFLWPDTYQSVAVMRINPQTVSAQLVPSTVSIQMAQRLEQLRTQLLSRSSLTTIITDQKFQLYKKLRDHAPLEDAIDQMQKDVRMDPLDRDASGDRRYATAFRVQFSYSDRRVAQAVVGELVSRLTAQNVQVTTESAANTSEFMKSEVTEAKDKLDKLMSDIAAFRAAHQGSLPENSGTNGILLANLQARIGQAGDRLSQMQQQKNSLETSLNNRVEARALLERTDDATPTNSQTVKSQNLINLDSRIHEMEIALTALQEQYQDKYPAVTTAQAQLKTLRDARDREQAKLDAEQSGAPPEPTKGLTLQQKATMAAIDGEVASLKTQIGNVDLTIDNITKEKVALEKEIRAVQERIDASPVVDQQAAQLQQDQTLAKERYEELKKRQEMSQTTQNLEERGWGETLDVLDPASLPQSPAQPNRYEIAAAGIGLGLMVGLALAGAKEAKDTSLKNLKDVRAYTNLPVLSSIPLLENALLVRRKRRLFWLAWSSSFMVGVVAMAAAMYYYFTPHTP